MWEKVRLSPNKGIWFEVEKVTHDEAFQNLLKSGLSFEGS